MCLLREYFIFILLFCRGTLTRIKPRIYFPGKNKAGKYSYHIKIECLVQLDEQEEDEKEKNLHDDSDKLQEGHPSVE
jgi:hypothetical protein